jgi:hypothetical protein
MHEIAKALTMAGLDAYVPDLRGHGASGTRGDIAYVGPYLSHDAPTASPTERGWANVGMPRLIALAILNQLGIRALNGLPVVAFAVDPAAVPHVTPLILSA